MSDGEVELLPSTGPEKAYRPKEITRSQEESIAQSVIPYSRDDSRSRYLGLRASGFTIREALKLIEAAHSTLSLWRKDPEFVALEERLPEFRETLGLEYVRLETIRNFRLVLEKDYRVLNKSLNPEYVEQDGIQYPVPMTKQEHEYLLKLRTFYTPQQLQVIQTLMTPQDNGNGGSFDFTTFVLEATRTVGSVKIEARKTTLQPTEEE